MNSDLTIILPYARAKNEFVKEIKENYVSFFGDCLRRKLWVIVDEEDEETNLVEERQYYVDSMISRIDVVDITLEDVTEEIPTWRILVSMNSGNSFHISFNSFKEAKGVKDALFLWRYGIV
jgi:hypothetical protein